MREHSEPDPPPWPTDFILGHKARLRGIMQAITGNDADELLQDLWVRSTRQTVPDEPEHYLTRAAKHLAIERFRSNQRRSSRVRPLTGDLEDETAHDSFESRELLSFLLGLLPSDQRQIVKLYHLDELTSEAVAEKLDISRATVFRKLNLAMATMTAAYLEQIA